ncbi:MAG TPA: glycosyltransferase family 4 protein [Candidatus Norongarragalinales archaeon]|nr:glycosyltransferase family 4 protein [Candidatus Norongarragalinales archaeon]
MKIALVTPFFYPVTGGVELHVRELAKFLVKKGHSVSVFTANIDHMGDPASSKTVEKMEGYEIRRYPVTFRIGQFASYWPSFANDLEGFDVIHAHNLRHPHVGIAMSKAKNIGALGVITSHSPWHTGTKSSLLQFATNVYDAVFLKRDCANAGAIIAMHEGDKQELISRGVDVKKISVIPNGVGESFFKGYPSLEESKEWRLGGGPVVLFVGRLNKIKGFDVLLPAFASFQRSKPGARLVIAGPDDGYASQVIDMIHDLKLVESVRLVGPKHGVELHRLFASCDFFASVSPYEPFGIVYLEAMAQGLPCVAINNGGPRYIIENGKTGVLCDYDVESVAGALRVLADAKKRAAMSGAARVAAEKYKWPLVCEKVLSLYYGKMRKKKS